MDSSVTSSIKLSLVIPCYNESKRIPILLKGIADFCNDWKETYEILIVDDGSKDDTVTQLESSFLIQSNPHIRVLAQVKNGGKGVALQKGVEAAKGKYILTLDADMSTSPLELLKWEKLDGEVLKNNSIYIGCRTHKQSKIIALQHRKMIGSVFNKIVKVLTPLTVSDTQCGFKLYPSAVAKSIFSNLMTLGWAHDVEILYQAQLQKIAIHEMPVTWKNEDDSKVNVIKDSIKMFFQIMKIALLTPLKEVFTAPFNSKNTSDLKLQHYARLLFVLIAIGLFFMMPKMSFDFGVTGDEHWHHDYGNAIYNYFFHGDKSILDYKRVEGSKKFEESGIHYYGGLFDLTVATLNHKLGLWGDYEMGHFVNSIVGFIGILFCGLVAMEMGGWVAGLLALLFIALSPSYFGQCFNNPKDIPFASACIFTTYYLIRFLKQLPVLNTKIAVWLTLGIAAALGVRIGGLLYIIYIWMFVLGYCWFTPNLKTAISKPLFIRLLIISAAGYALALIAWPFGHSSPIANPMETLSVMSHFFTPISLLFGGERIMNNEVPGNYISTYIGITAPLMVLIGLMAFVVMLVVNRKKNNYFFLGILLFLTIFPWGYAVYKQSALYDGWRHFLFIYPTLVVMAALAWNFIIEQMKGYLKVVPIVVVVGLMFLPTKFMAKNHPYEALYFNEWFGGINAAYTNYETDYWMNSSKESFDWLVVNEKIKERAAAHDTFSIRTNCVDPLSYYKKKTFGDVKNVGCGYVNYKNRMNMDDWDYGIFYSRFLEKQDLETPGFYPPASAVHVIRVDTVPVMVIIKRNSRLEKKYLAIANNYLASNHPDSALMYCTKTLAIYSENTKALSLAAQINLQLKNFDAVINLVGPAIAANPGNLELYYFLGLACLNKGDKANAKNYLEYVSKMNPGNPQLDQLLKQL